MTATDLKAVRGGESALAMAKRRYTTVYARLVKDLSRNFTHNEVINSG